MAEARDYREKQIEQVREWFKDHVATITEYGPLVYLHWGKPGTGSYLVQYVIAPKAGWLMVTGDLGSAVYTWTPDPPTNLEFLAGLELDYFKGKCEASPEGRRFESWDPFEAERQIGALAADEELVPEEKAWWEQNKGAALRASSTRDELNAFLYAAWDSGCPFAGEEMSNLAGCGLVTDNCCIAHWLGLKMAHEYLEQRKAA